LPDKVIRGLSYFENIQKNEKDYENHSI